MDRMKLKVFRVKKELTQKELSELAASSQQAISAYEKGTIMPSLKVVKRLADALGVHPGELY